MEDLGVEVRIVTLLGESLSNPIGEPSDAVLDRWILYYGDGEPVLKDRGYGYAIFGGYFTHGLGYPSYALVRPDMTVAAMFSGFSSWDPVKTAILADLD
jgi:hypothetical protein